MGREAQPPDLILADAAWLQRFGRKLVRSADLAEDLCQDTWLASLEQGQPAQRPWLARVFRNLAISLLRRNTRRQHAETRNGDRDPDPDTAEVVAEAEIQRQAVDALMDLAEPYRSTLLLRFMKGLSYKDVANRTEVPIETVRTRIKRGLSQLRQMLDQDHGGRRAWLPPLALPSFGIGTAALWGIVLMKIQTKLLFAGTGLAAALLALWFVALSPPSQTEMYDATERGTPLVADLEKPEMTEQRSERQQLEVRPVDPPSAPSHSASLEVRLTWHDTKEPAADLQLRFSRDSDLDYGNRTFGPAQLVVTGEDGTYRFEALEAGRFTIRASRPFYGGEGVNMMNDAFDILPGEAKVLEHEIAPGVDVQGRVVDRNGRGVPDAEILTTSAGSLPQRALAIATTDESGSFFIRSMHAASFLGATATSLGTSDFVLVYTLDHTPGRPTLVTLQLPDAIPAELTGTVFDPLGQPVGNARVSVGKGFFGGRINLPGNREGQLPPRAHLYTDAEGRFQVRELRAGTTPVAVYARGYAPWTGEVEIQRSAEVRIDLQPGASISGYVRDSAGRPPPEADVRAEQETFEYPFTGGYSRTDAQGRYELRDLSTGEFEILVSARGYAPVKRKVALSVGQEMTWDATLEVGLAIQGVLRDHHGQPLSGWRLGRDNNRFGAVTDDEGRFEINNVEQAEHTLHIFTDPDDFQEPVITRFEGIWPGEHDLTVPEDALPSAHVEGRVLMPDGRPAAEASVTLYFEPWKTGPGPTVKTDKDGRFAIGPLPPGEYTLDASLRGLIDAEFGDLVLLPHQRLEMGTRMLERGGHLTLKVEGTDDQLTDLRVALLDPVDGRRVLGSRLTDGQATLRLGRPGRYRLSLTGPDGELHTEVVEIVAEETLELTVELR